MKILCLIAIALLCGQDSFGQVFAGEDLFGTRLDTLYYPFYNGVQMIEVDHLGSWDRKIFHLEQSQPRAMPWSMHYPQPYGNEYFFRDSTGRIVKVFNTIQQPDSLTVHFRKVPLNKNQFTLFTRTHKSKLNVVWPYSPQPLFDFNGYHKIYEPVSGPPEYTPLYMEKVKYGLIDSLGAVVIPVAYEQILPLADKLLVQQNNKWGIISKDRQVVLPIRFDAFSHYNADARFNTFVGFMEAQKYTALCNVTMDVAFTIDGFDHIVFDYIPLGYLAVYKNGYGGLLNLSGEEVLPPVYGKIQVKDCGGKKCVSATKDDGEVIDLLLE